MLKFDSKGLIPTIIQNAESGKVLMLGYINKESLKKTEQTGHVWFYSRSRQELWEKGETSGNYLNVRAILKDCDEDTLLIQVDPAGPTCHTGAESCFYRNLDSD
jgi:phosphoribosyl-ATP pyrophosphohydrolase/phosphoribosyl-AMP cyclohydrolase